MNTMKYLWIKSTALVLFYKKWFPTLINLICNIYSIVIIKKKKEYCMILVFSHSTFNFFETNCLASRIQGNRSEKELVFNALVKKA